MFPDHIYGSPVHDFTEYGFEFFHAIGVTRGGQCVRIGAAGKTQQYQTKEWQKPSRESGH